MRDQRIDLNALLQAANIGLCGLLIFALVRGTANDYVDGRSFAFGMVLCLQTQLVLLLERRQRDPLVLLLAFQTTFYYSLRVFTLGLYPASTVFERYPYGVADTDFALGFILVANTFLYAGFMLGGRLREPRIVADDWRATSPSRVVVLLVVAILFGYLSGGSLEGVPRGVSAFAILLAPNLIVVLALTYFFLFRRTLSANARIAIACLIGLEIVAHTLVGSRSAVIGVIQNCILVLLATAGSIKFSRRFVVAGVVALPLFVALVVGAFAISTYNRAKREIGVTIDLGQALQTALEGSQEISATQGLDVLLPPIFARAGFLDFSAEIIAHRAQYREVIGFDYYGRSILDNLLTPGFDVFDSPKAANALQFIYQSWGTPSKAQLPDSYQSDQFGVYGESFALLGFAAPLALLLVAYALKRAYLQVRSANPFVLAIKRVVVLTVLMRVIDSFGLDWTIFETVTLVVSALLFSWTFAARRRRAAPTFAAPPAPVLE